jgi:hypothetical protein
MLQTKELGVGVKATGAGIIYVVPLTEAAGCCDICCRRRTVISPESGVKV